MPKASDNIKIYRNPNGPVVSTVNRRVLEQDGLTFKDIDGTGTLSPVNDWRNSPAERAAAYVKTLSVKEKIAQLFISDWRMAKYPITGPMADLYKDIEKRLTRQAFWMRANSAARQFSASSTCPAPLPCSKTGSTAMLSCVPTPPPPIWLIG